MGASREGQKALGYKLCVCVCVCAPGVGRLVERTAAECETLQATGRYVQVAWGGAAVGLHAEGVQVLAWAGALLSVQGLWLLCQGHVDSLRPG